MLDFWRFYIWNLFPEIKKEIEGKNIILVVNNATGQLGKLIAEKTGIFIEEKEKIEIRWNNVLCR